MDLDINEEQLDQIIMLLHNASANNNSLLVGLVAIHGHLNQQQLFGVEKDMAEKIDEYIEYFRDTYGSELDTLLENAQIMKTNYSDLDDEMKNEVSNG